MRGFPRSGKAERNWIAAATAHPFTFADAVEPLIGRIMEPPALKAILRRKPEEQTVPADLEALAGALEREPVSA